MFELSHTKRGTNGGQTEAFSRSSHVLSRQWLWLLWLMWLGHSVSLLLHNLRCHVCYLWTDVLVISPQDAPFSVFLRPSDSQRGSTWLNQLTQTTIQMTVRHELLWYSKYLSSLGTKPGYIGRNKPVKVGSARHPRMSIYCMTRVDLSFQQ